MKDPFARNQLAIHFCEALHEDQHDFSEPALLALCGHDPKIGGAYGDVRDRAEEQEAYENAAVQS